MALLRCCFLCFDWTTRFFCGAICRGSSRSVLVLELGVCGGRRKGGEGTGSCLSINIMTRCAISEMLARVDSGKPNRIESNPRLRFPSSVSNGELVVLSGRSIWRCLSGMSTTSLKLSEDARPPPYPNVENLNLNSNSAES